MDHLALAVRDQGRARRFYEAYLGFVAEDRPREDGVLLLHDARGFSLALGEIPEPFALPPFLHFGRGLGSPDEVRAFRERVVADGLELVDWWDEPEYVSVKLRDPDGYVVEVSWEPDRRPRRRSSSKASRQPAAQARPSARPASTSER